MAKHWRPYLGFCAAALGAGGLSALLTKGGMRAFAVLEQPPLAPPGWVFPVVWTVLYLLMGIGMARVWERTRGGARRDAVSIWAAQLAVNFFWSILFFGFEARLFAFFWLLALLALVVRMTKVFAAHDRLAARLQLPYLAWLAFAAYLNLGVWLLNR